jgi:hypothetical protein
LRKEKQGFLRGYLGACFMIHQSTARTKKGWQGPIRDDLSHATEFMRLFSFHRVSFLLDIGTQF